MQQTVDKNSSIVTWVQDNACDIPANGHALDDISNVLTDLIRGLQAEEVKVAQKVVVKREKLQIEFGQGKAVLPW